MTCGRRVARLALLLLLVAAPARGQEVRDEATPIASVGATTGWAIRQIAIFHEGGPQTDLTYQFVTLGVSGQLFGVTRWVGVRARAGVDFLLGLDIDKASVPVSFDQVGLHAELAPVFTYVFGDVGLHASAGVGFMHYFRGTDDDEVTVVAAQEVVQIPVTLGATVLFGDVVITPELGAAFGVYYDSEQGSIRSALRDGTATVQGLDLWLSLTVAAPL